MVNKSKKQLKTIEKIFERSRVNLPFPLKIKVAKLLLNLMARKKNFGLFIILGWQRSWSKYLDISDSHQDIFARHRINIMNIKARQHRRRNVSSTVNFDGAILINKKGDIIHSGVIIEGLRPKMVAQKINPGQFRDLSEQFGFRTKVHSRHLTAVAASYIFINTTVFTVSEENNGFHIFENGRIIYSTI